MAIAVDVTSTSIHLGTLTNPSFSWSHTITGSNPLLVVSISYSWAAFSTGASVTSLTYNSVALTRIGAVEQHASGSGGQAMTELWYLKAPATGANTIAVSLSGGTGSISGLKMGATSYTGADQSTPLDTSNHGGSAAANPAASITTGVANALVFTGFGWTDTSKTATSSQTSNYNDRTGGDTGGASSYQLATTAGSYSDTYTISTSSFMANAWIIGSFKPVTVVTNAGFLGLL